MAIKLQGFFDEIQPAMGGLKNLVAGLANPNYQQQAAVREMILRNPELGQQLIDMGPEQVEQLYGKGTGGFARGKRSMKAQVEDVTGAEMARIMALPPDNPERLEFIANRVGTSTPEERQSRVLQNKANTLQIGEAERRQQIRSQGAAILQSRQGVLFSEQNPLKPEEQAVIEEDDIMRGLFERQRDDYWKQQQMSLKRELQTERARGQIQTAAALDREDKLLARQIAYNIGGAAPEEVYWAINNRGDVETYAAKDPAKAATPQEAAQIRGAQAFVKFERSRDDSNRRTKDGAFLARTKDIRGRLSSPNAIQKARVGEGQIMSAIDEINTISADVYGMDDPNRPIYTYNVKPGTERRLARDEKTFYQIRGIDPETGTKVVPPSTQVQQWSAASKAQRAQALASVVRTNSKAHRELKKFFDDNNLDY